MSLRTMPSRFSAGSAVAPQSIRKLAEAPVTWKQVFCRPPEPKASPQPTNCTRISCCRFWLAAARRAEQPRQQPDRDHDHCAEQEVAPQPVHGVEAEIPEPLKQQLDAADDVVGIEADRSEHHADQDRQQDQAKRDRQRRAAEKAADAVRGRRQFSGVVGHSCSPALVRDASYNATRKWGTRHPPPDVTKSLFVSSFSIRSSVSSRSASRGGLSQRRRLMRGKRMATPDLCRGERCRPSNATSSTSPRSGS